MRKYRFLNAAVACLAFMVLARAQESSRPVDEFTVNGLKVILKTNPANDILSLQLYLRGGAANITESTQGIEPLLFGTAAKGSKNYPKEALNKIMDRTGSGINTYSTRDYSALSLRCLKRDFDEMWNVFSDIATNPALDSVDVSLVRNTMLSGIRQRKDNPDGYLRELTDEVFYKDHPYRLDPNGTEATVSAISVDQMRKHLSDQLQTSKLLLVAVGNITKADLMKKVEQTFGKLPPGNFTASLPPRIHHDQGTLKVVEQKIPTNYIQGTFSAPNLADPDYSAMTVAMDVLQWRLFEEVRTKRNLSYAPAAGYENQLANRGYIYVTAVSPDTTIKVMLGELKKLQTELVSAKVLKDRIALFLTEYYQRNETNASQGSFLAGYELAGLGWKAGDTFIENIKKVTAEDVQRVASKYFHNLQFVVIGDPKLIDQKVFTSM
jgi:zinc protease